MLLPPLRVKGDVGHHVDGSLKDKERPIRAKVMKAVPGKVPLHIDAKGFPEAVGAALVGMVGNACLVCAHKHRVVVFGVLIQQPFPDKVTDHLRGDPPVLYQIGKHPAGVPIGKRQNKRLGRLLCLLRGGWVYSPSIAQQ